MTKIYPARISQGTNLGDMMSLSPIQTAHTHAGTATSMAINAILFSAQKLSKDGKIVQIRRKKREIILEIREKTNCNGKAIGN